MLHLPTGDCADSDFLAGAALVLDLAGAAVVVVVAELLDLAVVLDCAPAFRAIAIANTVTKSLM
jgi:hypothetical protein